MKKALLLILCLASFQLYPQAPNLYSCHNENVFDLSPQTPILLGASLPEDFTVTYHTTISDANLDTNAIAGINAFTVTTNQTTIYARVENNSSGVFTIGSFLLIVASVPPAWQYPDYTTCETTFHLFPLPFGNFYTAAGGHPEDLQVGLTVYNSMTMYIYGETENGNCVYETNFHITIDPAPQAPELSDVSVPVNYILPALTAGNYFTGPNGSGTPLFAGDAITAAQLIYIYTANANCSSETSFYVEIIPEPEPEPDPVVNPNIQWQKTYGGSHEENPYRIKTTADMGYIIVGNTQSNDGDVTGFHDGNNGYPVDAWILKLDQFGAIQWEKAFGGSNVESAQDVIQLADGGFAVVGFSNSSDAGIADYHGLGDAFILKLDSSGNTVWQKAFGGITEDGANGILETADGNLMVVGSTYQPDVSGIAGTSDIWVFQTNGSGDMLWQKTYGGTANDSGLRIVASPNGGYLIGGLTASNNGDFTENFGILDAAFLKIDSDGVLDWTKSIGTANAEFLDDLGVTSDGGYIVAGEEISLSSPEITQIYDGWIIKLNASGDVQWHNTISSIGGNTCSVHETPEGGYLALAGTGSLGDLKLVNITANGTTWREDTYGGPNPEYSADYQLTPDGGLIACGSVYPPGSDADFLVVKISSAALGTPQSQLHKLKIYPNPVRDVLKISNGETISSISVYNLIGQLILSENTNNNAVDVTLGDLKSGIYLVKIKSGNLEKTVKIVKE